MNYRRNKTIKYYAEYHIEKLDGSHGAILGSDGILILDGRNRFSNMISDAQRHCAQLLKDKYIIGISIQRGDFRHSKELCYIPRYKDGIKLW